jgi:cell division FtsZ-interacting protein ZapD
VLALGGGYRAYALVQYPLGQANRMLLDQIRKNARLETKVQASKAYQELEKDVRDARTDQVGN